MGMGQSGSSTLRWERRRVQEGAGAEQQHPEPAASREDTQEMGKSQEGCVEQGKAATAVLLPSSYLGSRGASPKDPQAIGCDALPKPSHVQSFPVHYAGTNLLCLDAKSPTSGQGCTSQ